MSIHLTLKDLRIAARWSKQELARRSELDAKTVTRAESGQTVQEVKAAIILDTLNKALGTSYTLSDVEGVAVK